MTKKQTDTDTDGAAALPTGVVYNAPRLSVKKFRFPAAIISQDFNPTLRPHEDCFASLETVRKAVLPA